MPYSIGNVRATQHDPACRPAEGREGMRGTRPEDVETYQRAVALDGLIRENL